MSSVIPEEGERFLRQLRSGLSSLPLSERDEIVDELRDHLTERYAAGRADVLSEFGTAEAYAAQFLEERSLASAVAEGSSLALGKALTRGVRSVGETLFIVAPLLFVQGVSVLAIVVAALKVVAFRSFGLFRTAHGGFWIGYSDGVGDVDVLGWWTIPVLLVPSLAVMWGSRRVLAALANRRLARARADLAPFR